MHRYSRDMRPGYPLKPAMLIDFFSFLPFLLELTATNQRVPGLTFLRLLRVRVYVCRCVSCVCMWPSCWLHTNQRVPGLTYLRLLRVLRLHRFLQDLYIHIYTYTYIYI